MPCSDMGRGARLSSVNPPGCGSWWDSGTEYCSSAPRGWQQISPSRFTGRLQFTKFHSPNNSPSSSERSYHSLRPKAHSGGLQRVLSWGCWWDAAAQQGSSDCLLLLCVMYLHQWSISFHLQCDLLQCFAHLCYWTVWLKASSSQHVKLTALLSHSLLAEGLCHCSRTLHPEASLLQVLLALMISIMSSFSLHALQDSVKDLIP